ncbi:Heat shock 70 kDa protein 14 [Porphyridium purpureum]|uniref:Heat shock 70 kDa protein 14 n=1 Tax=Porphyridium purpureum TaxID=35688 RepID=A0A5J4YNT2_PORPP|nr:Heat shock 70 kDa protein 14 [Porphyridium purpureum]|eukprot:POR8047..scf295_9
MEEQGVGQAVKMASAAAACGIDFGNKNCVIALARKGGVDIAANEVSNRATPLMVGFAGAQRHLGEAAANFSMQNFRNTVTDLKRFLGLRMGDPVLEAERKRVMYDVDAFVDDDAVVSEMDEEHQVKRLSGARVMYGENGGESTVFSYEALVAMMLHRLLETANEENGSPVSDIVISVPGYYTDIQRRAMLDACRIADIRVLRLMNEHAAVALSYGIFRTRELPDKEPVNVAFVDMGQSQTTVTIASFLNTGATVKSVSFDPFLGGRNYEDLLVDFFCEDFKAKYNLDVAASKKPLLRIQKEVEKIKKILSANQIANLSIECLMDDTDVRSPITREQFEAMCIPLNERLAEICRSAVVSSGLDLSHIHSVEMVGGGTRVPSVIAAIETAFSRAPMRTLNADECIARGCALQAAILSPAFRVRDYALHDVSPYAVQIVRKAPGASDQDGECINVIDKFCPQPALKALSFANTGPLCLITQYKDSLMSDRFFADYFVDVEKPVDSTPSKVRIKIRLDGNGCIQVASAQEIREIEVEEPVQQAVPPADAAKDAPKMDEPKAEGTGEAPTQPNGTANGPTTDGGSTGEGAPDASSAGVSEADAAAAAMEREAEAEKVTATPPTKKVKKSKATDLVVRRGRIGLAMSDFALRKATEDEASMRAADKYIRERQDAMNALESFVYDMRSRLEEYGDLHAFADDHTRANLAKAFEETENWLYSEEADTAVKSVFVAKRDTLVAQCAPILYRKTEADQRPILLRDASAACEKFKVIAVPNMLYEHLSEEEKMTVIRAVEDFEQWVRGLEAQQATMSNLQDPVLTSHEVRGRIAGLEAKCRPIMTKPKPAPPKVEEPAPAPPTDGSDEAMKDDDEPAAAPGSAPADSGDAPMETEEPPKPENQDAENPMEI